MAKSFGNYPARPSFGTFTKNQYSSDYIENKRSNVLYNSCKVQDLVNSESSYIFMKKLTYTIKCVNTCNELPFNKTNLEVNLITKENLDGITVIESKTDPGVPSTIDPTKLPVYSYYNIDPQNKLYGITPCGVNNFINYMVLDTPSTNYLLPGELAGC
jgi:hypothetical protein